MNSFPLWATAAAAALLTLFAIIAALRTGSRQMLVLVAAVAGVAGIGLLVVEWLDFHAKAEQRRAIEARLSALAAQALAPNSNLACLDAAGGSVVHEACERALFAGPEQVAAALNYVGARLDLLREIAALAERGDPSYDSLRMPIVRSIEADAFGLAAQVLVARDGCTASACDSFRLLQRHDRIAANMNEGAYDARVARFAAAWSEKPSAPSAPALASHASANPSPVAPTQSPVNITFPSSASIPPISIMSNEPGRPGQNGVDAPTRPEVRPQQASPPPPPRRPAQKAQAPRREPPPQAEATADPFPQPVGSAQSTGTQPQ
ncbi:hypothetical protein [Pseudorhodoplanes sp.]|uniref:hypothetical protein n=1 Tax=Pseudorhodoplanes sp. TaxID=1934341 RepID=UPI003D0BD156